MRRRPAITLLEVLVSIFIMGIGMLAILVLYPLGAIGMARAIRDDRYAQSAQQAVALADANNFRKDPAIAGPPIFLDPIGVNVLGGGTQPLGLLGIGNGTGTQITGNAAVTRLAPQIMTAPPLSSSQAAMRWCTLQDELTFDQFGQAGTGTTSIVDRGSAYSWAYLVFNPTPTDPNATPQLKVIVYRGRDLSVAGGEYVYYAAQPGTVGSTSITLNYNDPNTQPTTSVGKLPPLKPGGWVLHLAVPGAGSTSFTTPNFYRVVAINDQGGGQLQLELQNPLRNAVNPAGVPPDPIIILENAVEVFDR